MYKIAQAQPEMKMLAAVTSAVKAITNISDVVISFHYFSRIFNNTYATPKAILRESDSGKFLKILNADYSNQKLSLIMSRKLGVPLTMESSIWYDTRIYDYYWYWFGSQRSPRSSVAGAFTCKRTKFPLI